MFGFFFLFWCLRFCGSWMHKIHNSRTHVKEVHVGVEKQIACGECVLLCVRCFAPVCSPSDCGAAFSCPPRPPLHPRSGILPPPSGTLNYLGHDPKQLRSTCPRFIFFCARTQGSLHCACFLFFVPRPFKNERQHVTKESTRTSSTRL